MLTELENKFWCTTFYVEMSLICVTVNMYEKLICKINMKICEQKWEFNPRVGDTPIKRTGLLVGNSERNPKGVPRSCFVGVA